MTMIKMIATSTQIQMGTLMSLSPFSHRGGACRHPRRFAPTTLYLSVADRFTPAPVTQTSPGGPPALRV